MEARGQEVMGLHHSVRKSVDEVNSLQNELVVQRRVAKEARTEQQRLRNARDKLECSVVSLQAELATAKLHSQAQDAEVVQSPDQIPASNAKKDESSDEEEDELGQGLSYGNIKEKKDVASAKQQDDKLKAGYGFDDKTENKAGTSAGADGA